MKEGGWGTLQSGLGTVALFFQRRHFKRMNRQLAHLQNVKQLVLEDDEQE